MFLYAWSSNGPCTQRGDYEVQRTRRHRPLQRPGNRRNSTPAELFTPRPRSVQSRVCCCWSSAVQPSAAAGCLYGIRPIPALLAKQMPRWEAAEAASCPEAGRSRRVYTMDVFIEHVCLRTVTRLIAGWHRPVIYCWVEWT